MGGSLFEFSSHPLVTGSPALPLELVREGIAHAVRPLQPFAPPASVPPPPLARWLPVVSPTWRWDWPHLQFIRAQLDRVTNGEIDKLILQVPPQHGKTELTTVRYPAWRLERDPGLRVIVGAYNDRYARKLSRKVRRIAATRVALNQTRAASEEWETAEGGGVRAAGVGAGIAGYPGDLIVIDDPVRKREDAESEAYREKVWDWYTDDLYPRRQPNGAMIVIMTRWHEDDLVGRILSSEDGPNWTLVSLPALAEAHDPLGRDEGEALCPDRFDEDALADRRRVLGEYGFASLYQQRPAPAGGGIFKRAWFKFFTPRTLPPVFTDQIQSWDLAFKANKGSSYVVGQHWAQLGANVYWLGGVREKLEFPDTVRAMRALASPSLRVPNLWRVPDLTPAQWRPNAKLVEDKANGPAAISTLRNEVPGLVAVPGNDDKVASAHGVSWYVEAGNVWLPDPDAYPSLRPVVEAFLLEVERFPASQYTDQAVAFVQAVRRLVAGMQGGGSGVAPGGGGGGTVEMSEMGRMMGERFG